MSVSLNWGNSSILNPQYGLVVAGRVNITKIFLCAFRISTGVDTAQVRLAVPSCYLGYLIISRTEPCLLILGPCHNTGCTLKYTSPARVRLHTQICYLSHTSPAQRESSSGIKRAQADVRQDGHSAPHSIHALQGSHPSPPFHSLTSTGCDSTIKRGLLESNIASQHFGGENKSPY